MGHLLGVLYLDSRASAVQLNSLDHKLLDAISTEAAILLDKALLAESERKARIASEELAIATRIYAGRMPATLPSSRYCMLQARTVLCLEIGGDFYDVIRLPDALGVVIADVSLQVAVKRPLRALVMPGPLGRDRDFSKRSASGASKAESTPAACSRRAIHTRLA
jgi:hypothetical protein